MAHPFSDMAKSTHKSKTGSMGKTNNLDIPIMRAVGENKKGGIHVSSASMQHKNQSAADGMKRGGHVGKPKHHKPKVAIVAPTAPPDPTMDPAMAGAGAPPPGAGMPPPGAMPPPGQPPMKRGGKVKKKYDDEWGVKSPDGKVHEFARGGKVSFTNVKSIKGAGENGEGRLDKIKAYGLKPIKG